MADDWLLPLVQAKTTGEGDGRGEDAERKTGEERAETHSGSHSTQNTTRDEREENVIKASSLLHFAS